MDKKLLMFMLVGLLIVGILVSSEKGNADNIASGKTQSSTYEHSGYLQSYDVCTIKWTLTLSGLGTVTINALGSSGMVTITDNDPLPWTKDVTIDKDWREDKTIASVSVGNIDGTYDLDVSVTNCKEDKLACTSHSSSGCKNGDVYWKDSCGTWEELKQDCKADETCKSGVCEKNAADCTSHASYACKQGTTQIWWKDSCGAWEELKQDCGAAGCSGQTCNSVQQDTCTSKGFKCCSACTTGTEKSDFYANCKPKFCCVSCAQEEATCSDNWGRDHKGDSRKDSGTFQACCDGSWETIVVNR